MVLSSVVEAEGSLVSGIGSLVDFVVNFFLYLQVPSICRQLLRILTEGMMRSFLFLLLIGYPILIAFFLKLRSGRILGIFIDRILE